MWKVGAIEYFAKSTVAAHSPDHCEMRYKKRRMQSLKPSSSKQMHGQLKLTEKRHDQRATTQRQSHKRTGEYGPKNTAWKKSLSAECPPPWPQRVGPD